RTKPPVTVAPPAAPTRALPSRDEELDKLLSRAEEELLAQHLDAAQKLTDEARAIKPDHVRVVFLAAQIAKDRERDIESARAVAPNDGEVRGARRQLVERLQEQAPSMPAAGEADHAGPGIQAAADSGASHSGLDALNQEAQRLGPAAKPETPATSTE